jgi:hypothetical protein
MDQVGREEDQGDGQQDRGNEESRRGRAGEQSRHGSAQQQDAERGGSRRGGEIVIDLR